MVGNGRCGGPMRRRREAGGWGPRILKGFAMSGNETGKWDF